MPSKHDSGIEEEKILRYERNAKPSMAIQPSVFLRTFLKGSPHMLVGVKTHRSAWVACASNPRSLRPHRHVFGLGPRSHTHTHMGFLLVSSGGNRIQNNACTSQTLSPWRQPDVVHITHPHSTCEPRLKARGICYRFPPEAAGNNQGDKK